MIAVNLTESQAASIAGASGEIVVRGPDGEVIGYLHPISTRDEVAPTLSVEELLLIKKRMADPIEMTITTEELVRRLDEGSTK
jgi:hypothetical protein